ncbi:MAG: response regulator transcription factor [Faecalibacterium sp.]|nr:response regulator transcription factor [Ruminococcus sp.]MCM1391447.1 response regulator transcription factor [Ruminococcus sp.]MCM1485238.1 response regulator transcription factor [Faecalibacterium sp.]
MNAKILVVEDDEFLNDGLCEILHKADYDVESVTCCKAADEKLCQGGFALVILDVMLPDGTGFDFCAKVRSSGNNIPVLFLTACDDEIQVVRGLDCGGDDYVTKPFKLQELLSRVRALLRRTALNVFQYGDISIDFGTMTVRKNDKNIFVTPTEFQLLAALVKNGGVIVRRNTLLESIWDNDGSFIDSNTLSVHISRLREKIGGEHILTVRGIGYRWES